MTAFQERRSRHHRHDATVSDGSAILGQDPRNLSRWTALAAIAVLLASPASASAQPDAAQGVERQVVDVTSRAGLTQKMIITRPQGTSAVAGRPSASQTTDASTSTIDPRDGKHYPVVAIAGMTWMARNLAHAVEDSVCPRDDAQACETEGRLYPWAAAMTACPPGWHLSTEDEWQRLERALGMSGDDVSRDRERGPGLGDLLKQGGSTGLNFPLAGWRRPDGSFRTGNGTDRAAAIWTSTRVDDAAWHRDLSSARTGIWRSAVPFAYSLSVRCVKS